METKIFFTDLDSTLLTKDKRVSSLTYETLAQWTAKGHKLVLCSGRALNSILHVRNQLDLNFPNMYLIGCNGGEIYDCTEQKMLLRVSLTRETAAEAFSIAYQLGIYIQTYTDTHILTKQECPQLTYYRSVIHTPYLLTDDLLTALKQEPCKCLAIELEDQQKLEHFRQTIQDQLGDRLMAVYSTPNYLELFPRSSGKGTGLKWLCRHLSLPLKHSLAAGDELNDISMIQAAGLGIAMQNAREEVKAAADLVTKEDNNHDGLVSLLLEAMGA